MIKVLLVEDNPADAAHIMALLCEVDREDFAVTYEASVPEAVARLSRETFDAALLELTLAGAGDLPGLTDIKAQAPLLPIVLLCARGQQKAATAALKHGAQDYIEEDDRSSELLSRSILYAINRAQAAEQLAFLSRHDPLTGLANRTAFRERIAQALARSGRNQQPGALLLVDLDSFKAVNDTRGHDVGDLLLRDVADQLRKFVRPYDVIARLGGDEFGILLENVDEARDAGKLAHRLLESIAEPVVIGGHEIFSTASLGAAVFPFDGADAPSLLRNADFAMYRAKRQGGGTAAFYTPSMGARIREQLALEHDLHRALAHDEFLLHYQPQVSLTSGRIVGLEALVRWQHPERGLVPPNAFIPAAEKSGIIGALGEWALRTACLQRQQWAEEGLDLGRIAVNLSPRQLTGNGFVAVTERTLREVGLDPKLLELEITEALFLEHDQPTIEKLSRLKQLGLRISIDDFGTGYSCLSRLTNLPVDALKIDRSFVSQASDQQNAAVTRAIIALARELELGVTCEGVETEKHATFLQQCGCDVIQGNLVSTPRPPEDIPTWAAERRRRVTSPTAPSGCTEPTREARDHSANVA
ncbi:MAG: EAL domain-containing protein [Candidatus Binatia bacterium]|nr:EAL domain-containing protein [Candidatus Binatia bacterium]